MAFSLKWEEVDSSNVAAVAFVGPLQIACVKFNNGGLYSYGGVSDEVYKGLLYADSVGKYVHNVLKLNPGMYPYTKWNSENELIKSLQRA